MNKQPDHHANGEKDYGDGKYNPPTRPLINQWIEGRTDEEIEHIKEYEDGWHNAKKQDKK